MSYDPLKPDDRRIPCFGILCFDCAAEGYCDGVDEEVRYVWEPEVLELQFTKGEEEVEDG